MGLMSFLVRLGLDGSQFETGLARAKSAGTRFASDFKSQIGASLVGALSVGAVTSFAKAVVNMADDIGDLAEQLNITTDEVQKLQILAGQTGVSFEKLGSSIVKVNSARAKAMEDAESKERAYFAQFGIGVQDLNDKSVTNLELVRRIGQAYVDAGKPLDLQRAIAELLGQKLTSAAGAIAKINELGPIKLISKEELDKLGEMNDRLDEVARRVKVAAVPALAEFGDELADFLKLADSIGSRVGSQTAGLAYASGIKAAVSANPLLSTFQRLANAVGFGRQSSGKDLIPFEGPFPADGGPNTTNNANTNAANQLRIAAAPAFRTPTNTDPLSRIGGFTQFGAGISDTRRMMEQQTRLLQTIASATKETAVKIDN